MERKKIGLALSGGGARGFAHIGVLKVLAEHKISFDMIAGTSAGAIIGGCLAAGMTPVEIEETAAKVGYLTMVRPSFSTQGALSNVPMGHFLESELPVKRFEELTIPFAAVAFDLVSGQEVVQKGSGDLVTAIRASCSVPGLFMPVNDAGRMLVDGGVTSVLPVDAVRSLGADVVISIDVLACGSNFKSMPKTAVGIMIRSAITLIRSASNDQRTRSDFTIEPQIAHLRPDQINKRKEFIELGEAAARKHVSSILTVIEQT